MKALICGSRSFNHYKILENRLKFLPIKTIISGGARGADLLAERYADEVGIEKMIFYADWEKHGKKAGYIRNAEMIKENPNLVVAFWDGESNGTKDTINKAKKLKIDTLIIYF